MPKVSQSGYYLLPVESTILHQQLAAPKKCVRHSSIRLYEPLNNLEILNTKIGNLSNYFIHKVRSLFI